MEKVVLGFGSNVGRRLVNINRALKLISLSPDFDILAVSPIYETEPWGFKNQNNFLNCVSVCLYRSSPLKLIGDVKKIEKVVGRKTGDRWMPREIDIDILFFGSRKILAMNLIIPHPQVQHRNFVLKPLDDLMPDFVHPVLKKNLKYLYLHSKDICKVKMYKFQEHH